MLLRVVHHVLEIEHDDVCSGKRGFFQSCVVVSWDDQPRSSYSICHKHVLCSSLRHMTSHRLPWGRAALYRKADAVTRLMVVCRRNRSRLCLALLCFAVRPSRTVTSC